MLIKALTELVICYMHAFMCCIDRVSIFIFKEGDPRGLGTLPPGREEGDPRDLGTLPPGWDEGDPRDLGTLPPGLEEGDPRAPKTHKWETAKKKNI